MGGYIETAAVALAGMITLLCLILGLEKMIKIIMGNYLIGFILLGMSNLIDLINERLLMWAQTERRVDIVESWIAQLLAAGKPTLMLTVYFIMLLFMTTKSQIGFGKVKNEMMRWIFLIVFLPCTVISIMLTLGMAIMWPQILDLHQLKILAADVAPSVWTYNFIMLTPLWVVLPGLVTFVIAAFFLRSDEGASKLIEVSPVGKWDDE